jgi:hypothetical protein
MYEQSFNPQPTARKSLFYSQLDSASHNPHQLGFEFDIGQVDHSRKVILSRLRRFEYEYRFAEYEYEYDEIRCDARRLLALQA